MDAIVTAPAYVGNSAFIDGTKLQWAFDSTSIGALKTCPRYYELSIVEGWAPRTMSVHLRFGIHLHEAREYYYRLRAGGQDHDGALLNALAFVITETYDDVSGRPWTSDEPTKNRLTLVRTLVWYLDEYKDDTFETIILADGRPAVELSFKWQTDYLVSAGDGVCGITSRPVTLCGHMDRLVTLDDKAYVSDLKTTKQTLSSSYFDQFTPDNQLSLYALSARQVLGFEAKGVIVDAAQVAVTFSRFERREVGRTADQLGEWYAGLGTWLAHAEQYAREDAWPQNEKACFRCGFRTICAKPPSVRAQWLAADFIRRQWNPLVARGDI